MKESTCKTANALLQEIPLIVGIIFAECINTFIAERLETWSTDEAYSNFTRTRPNKGIYHPMSPKTTEKRENRERQREREEKV